MLKIFDTFQRFLFAVSVLLLCLAVEMLRASRWKHLVKPKPKPIEPHTSSQKVDEYTQRILEIIPDADPIHLHVIVKDAVSRRVEAVIEHALDEFFLTPLTSLPDTIEDSEILENMNQGDFRDAIECGCCFATYPFEEMVQCVETHLFCSGCMNSHASILLGAQNPDIRCVDQSGCTAEILPSQLRRVLSPQTMELWERVKQRQDLDAARLENLQCCPFCDWGCIIEDDPGEILMCRNKNVCGVKSCRWCKKLDHRPKVCAVNTEKGKHHVDEAMSGALVRRCPGCKKPFIKESGCNKMMCPYSGCGTFSCYICRQIVKGYDHFDASTEAISKSSKKCRLWDKVEEIHAEDVRVAAERALKDCHVQHTKADVKSVQVTHPPIANAARLPLT